VLSYAAFLLCLEALALTVLVLWLDPRAPLNRITALIGLLAAFSGFCRMFALAADPSAVAPQFYRLSFTAEFWIHPVVAWLLLTMAETPKRLAAGILVPFSLALAWVYAGYLGAGFPYTGFRSGAWGNVGVLAAGTSWFTAADALVLTLYLMCGAVLTRAGSRITSQRQRHLVKVALVSLAVVLPLLPSLDVLTYSLDLPRLDFLPGMVLIAFTAYLVIRYRHLRRPMPPLEEGFSQVLRDPAFLLDRQGRILGVNEAGRAFFPSVGPDSLVGMELGRLTENADRFGLLWKAVERRSDRWDLTGLALVKSVSPHYDRFGDFLGALVLMRARTEPFSGALYGLSEREAEILDLLVRGETYQAIAARLFIAPGTVKRHAHNILHKTGTKDRTALFQRFGSVRE